MSRPKQIGIFAPSLPSGGERAVKIKAGIAALEALGVTVRTMPSTFSVSSYRSATPEERARDFMELVQDPAVEIIMATTGGYNTNEILEFLDWEVLRSSNKVVAGYSDMSALLLALYARTNLLLVLGSMVVDYVSWDGAFEEFFRVLSTRRMSLAQPTRLWEKEEAASIPCPTLQYLKGKRPQAEGRLCAANLSTFNLMLQTPFFPDLFGAILFLEYDKEEQFCLPSIERFLWQLRLAGVLKGLAGLVFGTLQPSVREEEKRTGRLLKDILTEVTRGYDYPVIYDAAFGHMYPSWQLPLGAGCLITAESGSVTLSLSMENHNSAWMRRCVDAGMAVRKSTV